VIQPIVKIENTHTEALEGISIRYSLNNGPYTDPLLANLNARSVRDIALQELDLTAYGRYVLDIVVSYPEDSYRANDTLRDIEIFTVPSIDEYPYLEDFEESNGGWFTNGENNSWEWGAPEAELINKPAEGSNAWVTDLDGNHNDLELSYLQSPCFDLTGLQNPMLSFAHSYILEENFDYLWVEYTENEQDWHILGSRGEGHNWYNADFEEAWDSIHTVWHVASIPFPIDTIEDPSRIRIRFVMDSDLFVNEEGVAIDMVHVHEFIPIDTAKSGILEYDVTVHGEFQYLNNGFLSIRGNYQVVDGGFNGEVSRGDSTLFDGVKTYLPRQWNISGSFSDQDNASIGLAITEKEAFDYLRDTCVQCIDLPEDPFELGVSEFSGLNNDLELKNNFGEDYTYYNSLNSISIPYGNGYLVTARTRFNAEPFEFRVTSDFGGNPLGGIATFDVSRVDSVVTLNWEGLREVDIAQYYIQFSPKLGSIPWATIDSVQGVNIPSNEREVYSYEAKVDAKAGSTLYYRICAKRENDELFYTPARVLEITSTTNPGISQNQAYIYPNPSNGIVTVDREGYSGLNFEFTITDAIGREVLNGEAAFGQTLSLDLSPGTYIMNVRNDGYQESLKIFVGESR
jgi:hypothetical protein